MKRSWSNAYGDGRLAAPPYLEERDAEAGAQKDFATRVAEDGQVCRSAAGECSKPPEIKEQPRWVGLLQPGHRRLSTSCIGSRIRAHDLRHFAATTMLSSQVSLAMASTTLLHSTLSTTTKIYGHLLWPVAIDAVKVIETALKETGAS